MERRVIVRRDACTVRFVVISTALLLMASCSSTASEYEDVDALASALRAEGLDCANLTQADTRGRGEGVQTSSGACALDGEGVQLFVFASEEDADLWFERGRMESLPVARGANWAAVPGSQETADRIAEALGGSS